MIRLVKRIIIVPLIALVAILVAPALVYAIADPDSAPSINAVYVYENCYEDGDVGVLVDYYLDYAALPSETAAEAYMAIFVDTDGTTQLKSVAPYVYQDSGYGRGLMWIRFTAAEATAYGLDSTNIALHEVWLSGNPALGWVPGPDPPKTIAGIDQWSTVGDPSSLIALRVLYYADVLEVLWSLDLIQEIYGGGSTLTTLGESYFANTIPHLRDIAPAAFSSVETDPEYTPLDYDTAFGGTATSGGATIVGSPVTLTEGVNTIDTGVTTGTIIIDLAGWTFGDIDDGTGTIAGVPIDLTPGINTLTVTGAGTFTVDVEEVTTITLMDTSVTGTGIDLTTLAATFGMSRWFLSGIVWMLITLLVCAAVYIVETPSGEFGESAGRGEGVGSGKSVMIVFSIMIVGGALLGMLSPLVASLLFIASGAFVGYVLFFRSETLHKGFMFMLWMFVIVSIAGNYAAGSNAMVATYLTSAVTDTETATINVASTDGFPDSGFVVIGDEHIGYPSKTDTTFESTTVGPLTVNPLTRGEHDTDAATHAENATVRTREAAILNASIDYKIARIADTAGVMGFITFPAKLLDLILTISTLPLGFLGTDLAALSYIWIVVAAGMIVGFVMSLAGGRRV